MITLSSLENWHRGTGLCDRPATASTVEDMVPDLIALVDASRVERAFLVGWSDRAAVAFEGVVARMIPRGARVGGS